MAGTTARSTRHSRGRCHRPLSGSFFARPRRPRRHGRHARSCRAHHARPAWKRTHHGLRRLRCRRHLRCRRVGGIFTRRRRPGALLHPRPTRRGIWAQRCGHHRLGCDHQAFDRGGLRHHGPFRSRVGTLFGDGRHHRRPPPGAGHPPRCDRGPQSPAPRLRLSLQGHVRRRGGVFAGGGLAPGLS